MFPSTRFDIFPEGNRSERKEKIFCQIRRYLAGILATNRDITERKKLEAELMHLDRLNLVGQIAASLGHEVRNPMQTARGFLQLFQNKPEYNADSEFFQIILEELDRANSIISDFLTLARDKKTPTRKQGLNDILTALEPLLSSDAYKVGCSLNMDCGTIPDIILDENEIHQLVINLVRNAIEAAPAGTVSIKTNREGETVALSVKDSGNGIPPEIQDHLGTPFLTTKENGTGLGLATCYSIALRHNAKIISESGPDGTTFTVRFPVIKDE